MSSSEEVVIDIFDLEDASEVVPPEVAPPEVVAGTSGTAGTSRKKKSAVVIVDPEVSPLVPAAGFNLVEVIDLTGDEEARSDPVEVIDLTGDDEARATRARPVRKTRARKMRTEKTASAIYRYPVKLLSTAEILRASEALVREISRRLKNN
jgi:hypothetical protein